MFVRSLTSALTAILVSAVTSFAQPVTPDHDASSAMPSFPKACNKSTQASPMAKRMQDVPMVPGEMMPGQDGLSDMGRDLMAAMKTMNPPMMIGMMAKSPDVAFLCSMIPHHQGAIDMARAALRHTKDDAVRRIAEKTVSENEDGIREMSRLLGAKAK